MQAKQPREKAVGVGGRAWQEAAGKGGREGGKKGDQLGHLLQQQGRGGEGRGREGTGGDGRGSGGSATAIPAGVAALVDHQLHPVQDLAASAAGAITRHLRAGVRRGCGVPGAGGGLQGVGCRVQGVGCRV